MSGFPDNDSSPPFIHTFTRFMVGTEIRLLSGSAAVAAFAWTANQAIYIPFSIPWAYPVRRLFWINGSTIGSNCDIGIYSERGARIYSKGSTAQSGTSVVQYVTPATPFVLPPGRYFLAWNCDGTTARAFGVANAANAGKIMGHLTQAVGAVTLPSPATFATYAGVGLPVAGFTRLASGF